MQIGNTFTYRHSDLPVVRPEIKAEILALDVQIADLITRSQGNYRELEELAEVLDNCLDSCEFNLKSIRIVADDSPQPSIIGIEDLSLLEKQIIFSIGNTSSLMLKVLSSVWQKTPEEVAEQIAELALAADLTYSEQEINNYIKELSKLCSQEFPHNPPLDFVFKRI